MVRKFYKIIGLMSGSSLDGLDMAYCHFHYNPKGCWSYRILNACTIPYENHWRSMLLDVSGSNAFEIIKLDREYGKFTGRLVNDFIDKNSLHVEFIASHGHTVIHDPQQEVTFQIGHGACISSVCRLPVICDFRSVDVALDGQGAPLVPVGDELLFGKYAGCLNLGGIANISFSSSNKRIAYDVCPVNILLNLLAASEGKEYDRDGAIAAGGIVNENLLRRLDGLEYYKLPPPKSLSRERVLRNFTGILSESELSIADKLSTCCEHMARQISRATKNLKGKVLVTGGGAYNTYLMERVKNVCGCEIYIPDDLLVKYKEALIFAFLGVLRLRKSINCRASVTGCVEDHVGGAVYWGRKTNNKHF